MYFFTTAARNYISKVRVLAQSIKKHNPTYKFGLVLCDEMPDNYDFKADQIDDLFTLEDLDLPVENLKQWIFKHTIYELCTAVKGQAFLKIFEKKSAEKVVHLDSDMLVMSNLDDLSKLLDKWSIILTPHLTEPEITKEAIIDNEILSGLLNGIYNLGFLAVKNNADGMKFIKWWRDRLMDFCYDDVKFGLFTDQRWVDFAPVFFNGVHILKDKTYNVATWNIAQRKVGAGENGTLSIDNAPMKIFHFSGFDSGAQEFMLKKYCKDKAVFDLREWYLKEIIKNGQNTFGKQTPAFALYSNKKTITKHQRVLYRKREDLMTAFPDPFVDYIDWYEEKFLFKKKPANFENLIETIANNKSSVEIKECLSIRENIEAINDYLCNISDEGISNIRKLDNYKREIFTRDKRIEDYKQEIYIRDKDIEDITKSISYRTGRFATFIFRYIYELGKKVWF